MPFNTTHFIKALVITTPLLSSLISTQVIADEQSQQRGLQIATEADQRDQGFGDSAVSLEMVLKNKHGDETTRVMRNKTLEQDNNGDKALIIFDTPRDVKGTAFLSHTHKARSDDQWLFLPALKRVKRIASSNKSGPFMGSEFAFEDIASQEVEKYTYDYLRDETLNEVDTFVIERDPVDPKSGYTRQVVWMDKGEYRVMKIDFYDRKNDLLKTLKVSDYHQYLDKFWRANKWEMVNHQTGKSTILTFSDYQFGNGFRSRDFNKTSLARAK